MALILGAIAGASIEWFWTGRTMKKDKKIIDQRYEVQSLHTCVHFKFFFFFNVFTVVCYLVSYAVVWWKKSRTPRGGETRY